LSWAAAVPPIDTPVTVRARELNHDTNTTIREFAAAVADVVTLIEATAVTSFAPRTASNAIGMA
jgi:hypothetical protein